MTAPRALIVEDNLEVLQGLVEFAKRAGFRTAAASTLRQAKDEIAHEAPDLLLVDVGLPDGSGLELLDGLQGAEVVFITGDATVETAVDSMKRGARDYLTKPLDFARLKATLSALARSLEAKASGAETTTGGSLGALVGASPPMQRVYDLIARVACTDASVLITGETGTGKEVVAETIHALSRRREKVFLAVDCGALSATLVESELFGHERGSFTGADRLHKGCFERAHGGTLFLDEVTEMPPALQVKLLRALESRTVLRVGGSQVVPADVRVLAATNRSLAQAVAEGALREDLLYRLNVFPIALPPLRDRGDDLDRLAEHFLGQLNAARGTAKGITPAGRKRLRDHGWPGNLRELKNALQRGYILAEEGEDVELAVGAGLSEAASSSLEMPVGTSLADAERILILAGLASFDGDKKKAAAALQISLKTLYSRLSTYRAD
jgi:DNA-binding NtrC family response regulator